MRNLNFIYLYHVFITFTKRSYRKGSLIANVSMVMKQHKLTECASIVMLLCFYKATWILMRIIILIGQKPAGYCVVKLIDN